MIKQHNPKLVATVAGRLAANHSNVSPDQLLQIADDAIREALILGGGRATGDSARTDAASHPVTGTRNDSRRHAAAADMTQQWRKPSGTGASR